MKHNEKYNKLQKLTWVFEKQNNRSQPASRVINVNSALVRPNEDSIPLPEEYDALANNLWLPTASFFEYRILMI